MSDLNGARFESQNFRFVDKRVTARPIGRSLLLVVLNIVCFYTFAEFVMMMFADLKGYLYYIRILARTSNKDYGSNSVNPVDLLIFFFYS